MSDKVGTGYVPIKPDTEGFGAELEKGLDKQAGPAADRAGKKAAEKFAKGIALAGAALIGKSVLDFGGFEKQMNEVFTLLPGISGDAMAEMTEQVKGFATEFGVIPQEVVPALYQSLSAGVPADNVFAFLETAQKLAKGGVTDLTTSVDGLSSVVNAYGSDVLSAEQASDLMFTTVKLGKTNIAELSSSLFQVTPTAAGLGVAFGDVTAALAAMTLQGVPTSVATTQLRQLFVELSKEGSAAAGTFEELAGKSFRQFVAEGGNVQEALQVMEKGAADTGVSISDMFGSVEAGSAALALTGGGTEAFTNALAGMDDSAGATQAAFETMNQGLSATLDKLKAKFSVALLNIGEQIAPTIGTIGESLGMLLEMFGKIPGPLQAVILLVGTLGAGLFAFAGPILKGIQLFKMLGSTLTVLSANPWVLVAAGLVLAAVLIIKNWEKVKEFFSDFVDFFDSLWDGFTDDEGTTTELFALKIRRIFLAMFDGIKKGFTDLWHDVTGIVSGAFGAIADFFRQWWPLLLGIFTGGIGLVVALVIQNWDAIWQKISDVTSAIVGAVTGAWDAVWGVTSSIGSAVVGFITGIPNAITGAFGTLAGIISAPFTVAFNTIKTTWNATVGGFGFKTPDWIPGLGGKSFTIPRMALGAVLDGPQLFLGGEYPGAGGNPEIVTPQNIMRETMVEAIQQAGPAGAAGAQITVERMEVRSEMDIYRIARELDRLAQRETRAQGRPTLASA